MWKISIIYIKQTLFILQSNSTPPSASLTKCRAMVLKTLKTVIISAAVTCVEVPALSGDLRTKVRKPSQ
jgi:hypothetical protein